MVARGCVVLLSALGMAAPCAAQLDAASSTPSAVDRGRHAYAWPVVASVLIVTALDDRRLSAFVLSHHTRALDNLARDAGPFGQAHNILPVLAVSVIAPRIAGQRALSDALLRVTLGYFAADGVESIAKPLVGRHRPSDGGSQWRFHPFVNQEQWHSFPSAHAVHTVAIATGLAMESHTRWVAIPAYGVATIVGLQRVYTGAHWGSDVIGSAALAFVVSGATDTMLRRRGLRWLLSPVRRPGATVDWTDGAPESMNAHSLRAELTPWTLGVAWTF